MASKNIVAKGTTYNGVESVTFPVSGGGNATFYEVSDTTAAASDVASGKYFYTSSGVKTEGTASGGGGGGLEYETGTYVPTENEYMHLQYFSNVHSSAPMFYSVSDATDTISDTTADNFDLTYVNFEQAFGSGGASTSTQTIYGLVGMRYKLSATNTQGAANVVTVPLSQSDGSNSSHPTYWATNEYIKFGTTSNSRYWRSGRTYKWIAVWAPTT